MNMDYPSKLDPEMIKSVCLQLDPFKHWDEQPLELQERIIKLGLKELYLDDPFKLTNFLLTSLHESNTSDIIPDSIQ